MITTRDGATGAGNIAALCRRHHQLKTDRRWTYQLDPDGTTTWTSHTGRHYRTRTTMSDPTADPTPAGDQPRHVGERPDELLPAPRPLVDPATASASAADNVDVSQRPLDRDTSVPTETDDPPRI